MIEAVITGAFDHLTLRRHAYRRNCKILNGQQSKLGTYKSSLKAGQDSFFFYNTTKRKHTGMSFTQHENPSLNMRRRLSTSIEETSILWSVLRNSFFSAR